MLRLYRYKIRKRPEGWETSDGEVWSKPGNPMRFTRCVLMDLPSQVDDLNANIPILNCLRDHGVDLKDFYEYQGEPRAFDIWPPETEGKPLADKMRDVVSILSVSKRGGER